MRFVAFALLAACQVNIQPYEDRDCDETHACSAGSGRECVHGKCVPAWDGGALPWPSPETTGVIAGTTLTASGPLTITQDGKVLEALEITGCVSVEAAHVVLRNLRIKPGSCTDSPLQLDGSDTLVEDVEIDGTGHAGSAYGITGSGAVLRRLHLHGTATGIRVRGDHVTLEHSLLHEFNGSNQSTFVTSGDSHLTLRHDVLEVPGNGDAVVTLYSQDAAITDVLLEANQINGAGWSVTLGGDVPALPTSNIRVLRNRFGRKFHAQCGSYGPVTSFDGSRPGNVWEGNVWDDTGAVLTP
ncbi:MAG: hypothetical protein IPJ65_33410 [Archangiaceae bacterium]|nr:hypothetical protein [Archangiaceae bacterium]